MLNFVLRGERREDYCGGLVWTWRRLLSGALFDEEGIWIASRLIIIQGVQLILLAFYTYSGSSRGLRNGQGKLEKVYGQAIRIGYTISFQLLNK